MRKVTALVVVVFSIIFILLLTGVLGVIIKTNGSKGQYKNWKTYTNEKFGYSLKYPSSWGATTTLVDNAIVLYSNPQYLKERLKSPQAFSKDDYAVIDTAVYEYGVETAAGEVNDTSDIEVFASSLYSNLIIPCEKTIIAGEDAVIFDRKNLVLKSEYPINTQNCPSPNNSCYEEHGIVKQVWVKLPKGLLLIEYTYGRGYEKDEYVAEVFNKVVKSLSFQK